MTNAQTEARAIVAAMLADKRLATKHSIETLTNVIIEYMATALAAKDEELAEAWQRYVDANEAHIDAEAQLAEARKALNAGEALSRQLHAVIDRLNGQAYSSTLSALNYFDAARRALEEQGGENG